MGALRMPDRPLVVLRSIGECRPYPALLSIAVILAAARAFHPALIVSGASPRSNMRARDPHDRARRRCHGCEDRAESGDRSQRDGHPGRFEAGEREYARASRQRSRRPLSYAGTAVRQMRGRSDRRTAPRKLSSGSKPGERKYQPSNAAGAGHVTRHCSQISTGRAAGASSRRWAGRGRTGRADAAARDDTAGNAWPRQC